MRVLAAIGPRCPSPGWPWRLRIFLPLLVLAGLIGVFEPTCFAQTFGAMKGFKVAEPYGPPYEKQTKSLLESGKAQAVRGGWLLSDGVTLQTFTETNTLQLLVRAQECFYNTTNHTVVSAGPLQMQTADGKFSIEGVGFFWQQTNSSLVISNRVHTLIRAELLQSSSTNQDQNVPNSDTGPLSILSRQFSY